MTIIEKIKQSIETATGLPFIYHAAGEINELLTQAKSLPIAYSFLIDSGTVQSVNGNYHEQITLAVMFCDKTEFDFNAIENEQIIDRMKIKAYKWLQSLRDNSNALRIVSVNSTQRLYDNTTAILTGYAVNITLQDTSGEGDCTLPDVVIPIESNGEYNVVGVDKVDVNVTPILQDLSITENGTYLPDEGYAGFSQVVANVVPTEKVKVSTFSVTNECINDDGIWEGKNLIDTSEATNFTSSFYDCTKLKTLDMSNWDVSRVERLQSTFRSCTSLKRLDISNWNCTPQIAGYCFYNCISLEWLDLRHMNFSLVYDESVFIRAYSLKTIIGDKTIDEVINDNICALYLNRSFNFNQTILDRASLRALINGLADLTGQTAQTLTLGATLMTKLTEEDIAIATNKNWTIA